VPIRLGSIEDEFRRTLLEAKPRNVRPRCRDDIARRARTHALFEEWRDLAQEEEERAARAGAPTARKSNYVLVVRGSSKSSDH